MEESKELTKEQIENAKGGKFGASFFASLFITVLSFSFIENRGWALLAGIILSVLAIRKIYSLDNNHFKDKPTFKHADDYDPCDSTDPQNYSNPCSPYYRGSKDYH
ncbi:hypothetical protein [Piscirickettsia salmonis]|uniref:hypothetical protein n=1 Tax=Piscirickettsia salmonis TaxID=1238 RepID=UPI0006BD471B|nr:hypothetical protein [Piscirickettsia salmonis]ALA26652.1 C4-dicarboxylate ABC transporter permease [Piscirickettsia salmonis]APS45865.1 hypothetical protein AVI48_15645 [Piscirickettsia salmonis]APS49252.1 hypothetical protein AVI49_16480 [Piscirickettsia salmonis]QGO82361.1 hypothetical protein Psal107_03412 [Piscirickettsia salmonis]QGP24190.1 hypothetical protein Psal158_03364 [Piscirickettsia salmonis]